MYAFFNSKYLFLYFKYLLRNIDIDLHCYIKLDYQELCNGLLNEIYKEFYSMVEETKTNDKILNYNNCLITLLAASSIDLCEAILNNGDDIVINDFYDRWKVLYNKTRFL